jgi:hypothetical protein
VEKVKINRISDFFFEFYLNHALTQPNKVRSDTDSSASDHGNSYDILVGLRGFTGDHSSVAQVFHAETILHTDDVGDLVPRFTFVFDENRSD